MERVFQSSLSAARVVVMKAARRQGRRVESLIVLVSVV
jgi:hypothetical protein